MNANELADELEKGHWEGGTREQAAAMLRQQADLIRNLQKSLGFKNSGYETINLTPQLELTDEEMELVYYKCFDLKNKMPDNEKRRSYFKFAKAILRKAQEK